MKLLTDLKYRENTIVLEDFKPNPDDALKIYDFCQDAYAIPETIGGIFFTDLHNQQHWMELKNQALYTLVFTLKSMALQLPLHVVYDNNEISTAFCETAFGLPSWLMKIMQFTGLMKRHITYADLIKQAHEHPSARLSPTIRQ